MKKKSKIIIAAAAAVAVIIVAVVAAVLITRGGNGSKYNEHLELADRYLEEMEYEQAIAELRAAIEIEPDRSDAYLALSEVYAAMNDYENALAALQEGYAATGDEAFTERSAEIEVLQQEYENQRAEAGQEQPGAGDGSTGRQEAGTEEPGSSEAGAEGEASGETTPDAEVKLRLQPVFDSLILFKEPLTPESSWQTVCDRLNIENPGEITDEDTLWESEWLFEWLYEGEGEGDTRCAAGAANYLQQLADDILYTYDYYVDGNSFDGNTRICYFPDGKLYNVYTDITDSSLEEGEDCTAVEGFAGFIQENQITSIADFLKYIGMEEVDPQCVALAETILSEYQYYSADYESDCGTMYLSCSMWTLSEYYADNPHVSITLFFEGEDAPWGALTIGEYASSDGTHGIYMQADTAKAEPWW